ncbi:putative glycosyl transferase RfaG [Desulforapulum autotrophicum HRM2]|uniref:Glycosyl transferase RfaG n=1 Tax=Desulforapulum autotrophicum (strain ATCC 43914 / DSM 3382 / VKM B-1955 / HRM2) TaxID=177437 RepID=C0QGX3_DESAH|nr:glycosyltransferase family 4 protein [Desulforapulum autotrophicum]ACN15622.1 putative glycosyl transferase RfaG [Desulforapulum autotrophicum HRM2]
MKLAIVRTAAGSLKTTHYNVQEIGLGLSLIRHGFNVDFYSKFLDIDHVTTYECIDGCELRLIPLSGICFKQITFYPGLIKELTSQNYDVVQVHEDSQLMSPMIVKNLKKNDVKTILYQGMYKNHKGIGRIYQVVLDYIWKNITIKNSDLCLAKTTAAKSYLEVKRYKRIEVQPIGINILNSEKKFPLFDQIKGFRENFRFAFFYVGIFEPRRNVIFLLELLKKFIDTFGMREACLIAVGKGPDLNKFKRKIKDLQISNNVFQIDSIPNDQLPKIYKLTDIFLLPSQYEIYGMVILEALLYGIPVFSTKNAGAVDIIKKEKFGILMDLDLDNWFERLNRYLHSKYIADERFKKLRSLFICDNFSWDILAERYVYLVRH